MKNVFLFSLVFLVSACTTVSGAGYYWGGYAKTSYLIVNEPSEQSYKMHIEELSRIIEKSEEESLKVPPGIHAELGFMFLKLGENESADTHFNLEKEIYPESTTFLERLMMSVDDDRGEEP